MKKDTILQILLIAVFVIVGLLGIPAICQAQDIVRKGNNFEQISKKHTASTAVKTKYTFTDSKGTTYSIYITKNGRCFINKISSKTGKEYKYYLKEEISKSICKEMKITYKSNK